jgi:hypothetical protein
LGRCPDVSKVWFQELDRLTSLLVHFVVAERALKANEILLPINDPTRPYVHPDCTYLLLPKIIDSCMKFPALKEAATVILESPKKTTHLEFRT